MNKYVANYLWDFKPTENKPIPTACIESNRQYTFETNIVSPADIETLLGEFAGLENLWSRIPHWIIKADLGRLLYIHAYGNFYFDVDCKIRKNLPAVEGDFLILFTEMILKNVNKLGPRECKNPENVLRVANYAFGTNVVRHPFLTEVIQEAINRLTQLVESGNKQPDQLDILWVCGPDVITSVFHQSRHRYPDLVLLDDTYLAHLCHGAWRD